MSEEIWTPNLVTMPSGIEVQPLSDNDPSENTVLECLEKAKQQWLSENPGSTEMGWELISDLERDTYVEQQMVDAGFTKSFLPSGHVNWEL